MDYASVSIQTPAPDGGVFGLTVTKVGPNKATLETKKWATANTSGRAQTDTLYTMKDIVFSGNVFTCEVAVWPLNPSLMIEQTGPDDSPVLKVTVSHSIVQDGVTTYPVTAEQLAPVMKFLADADFPST